MKRLVVLTAIALMGFGTMFAQRGGGRHRMSVEEQVSNLKKELSLTDEQTKKVTALYTDFQNKMKEAEGDSREKMRSEREKLDKQVEALLTDDQKKAFQQMKSQHQRGPGQGREGRQEKNK